MLQGWAGAPRALLGCWAAGLPPLRACFSILPVGQFSVTSGGCDPHGHPHAYVNNSWDANVYQGHVLILQKALPRLKPGKPPLSPPRGLCSVRCYRVWRPFFSVE